MKYLTNKLFKILSIAIVSAILCGCGEQNQELSSTTLVRNENPNMPDSRDYENQYFMGYTENRDAFENVTNEQIQELLKSKNRELESTNFHVDGSYDAEKQTAVTIHIKEEALSDTGISFSGNFYDIDENYLYIITCRHSFFPNEYSIMSHSEINKELYSTTPEQLKKMYGATYVYDSNGNKIATAHAHFVISHNADIALIAIELEYVNQDFIDNIKTINIERINQNYQDKYVYACVEDSKHTGDFVKIPMVIGMQTQGLSLYRDFEPYIIRGHSGGGVFDENGYYIGEIFTEGSFTSTAIPVELPKMFNELNEYLSSQ